MPILDVIGMKTWYFGAPPVEPNVVKACVNYNLIHTLEALGESISLIESQGIAGTDFAEPLTGTLFPGRLSGIRRVIASRKYEPVGFSWSLASGIRRSPRRSPPKVASRCRRPRPSVACSNRPWRTPHCKTWIGWPLPRQSDVPTVLGARGHCGAR